MVELKRETKEGETFTGKPKLVSWERIWAFSGGPFSNTGWPRKNVHTDLEFAKSCGLPSVAASATQFMGYVTELMTDLFGVEWLSHGTMDVKFINLVDAGDVLVTKAEVKARESQGSATRFTMDISCENQKAAKVLVGNATGILGQGTFTPIQQTILQKDVQSMPNLQGYEFTLTPELNQQYLYGEEDFHPWYIEETEIGPPIGHPGLLFNMSNATRSPSYSMGAGEAGFHTRDEVFLLNPARVGKKLKVIYNWRGRAYEKRNRPYHVTSVSMVDEDGREILKRLSHGTIASNQYQKQYS
jgi:hypothetical protein